VELRERVYRRLLRRRAVRLLVLRRRLGVVGPTTVGPESASPPHLAAPERVWGVVAADGARFRRGPGCSECWVLIQRRMLLFPGRVSLERRMLFVLLELFVMLPVMQLLRLLFLLVVLLKMLQLLPMLLHSLLRSSIVEGKIVLLFLLLLLRRRSVVVVRGRCRLCRLSAIMTRRRRRR